MIYGNFYLVPHNEWNRSYITCPLGNILSVQFFIRHTDRATYVFIQRRVWRHAVTRLYNFTVRHRWANTTQSSSSVTAYCNKTTSLYATSQLDQHYRVVLCDVTLQDTVTEHYVIPGSTLRPYHVWRHTVIDYNIRHASLYKCHCCIVSCTLH